MGQKTDLFCETYLILLSLQMCHFQEAAYVSCLQNGDVQNQYNQYEIPDRHTDI